MRKIDAWKTMCVLSLALLALFGCDTLPQLMLPTDESESQGIFGVVIIHPGVCLEGLDHPGQCLNKPYPGQGTFDIRLYDDSPDRGFSRPIIKTFTSKNEGSFEVELPVGKYCVWWFNDCQQVVEVAAGEWLEVALGVFLP